ncbi:uncharacterized protein BJ171DRAFT_496271 [Polychytrium aggregatum]|uniref:uncharacterized protein n=1 Tax=Polychytrium aggregatum TaxID=110093 RepID=UPI0022FE0C52|nr:uncharacterized protein BJ171DRAFT_496271 [Polychytrium aggregatum]KAI9206583.1 hypothetical protein BJ171DRAFT_496271 [Polychytrium aggregatum]
MSDVATGIQKSKLKSKGVAQAEHDLEKAAPTSHDLPAASVMDKPTSKASREAVERHKGPSVDPGLDVEAAERTSAKLLTKKKKAKMAKSAIADADTSSNNTIGDQTGSASIPAEVANPPMKKRRNNEQDHTEAAPSEKTVKKSKTADKTQQLSGEAPLSVKPKKKKKSADGGLATAASEELNPPESPNDTLVISKTEKASDVDPDTDETTPDGVAETAALASPSEADVHDSAEAKKKKKKKKKKQVDSNTDPEAADVVDESGLEHASIHAQAAAKEEQEEDDGLSRSNPDDVGKFGSENKAGGKKKAVRAKGTKGSKKADATQNRDGRVDAPVENDNEGSGSDREGDGNDIDNDSGAGALSPADSRTPKATIDCPPSESVPVEVAWKRDASELQDSLEDKSADPGPAKRQKSSASVAPVPPRKAVPISVPTNPGFLPFKLDHALSQSLFVQRRDAPVVASDAASIINVLMPPTPAEPAETAATQSISPAISNYSTIYDFINTELETRQSWHQQINPPEHEAATFASGPFVKREIEAVDEAIRQYLQSEGLDPTTENIYGYIKPGKKGLNRKCNEFLKAIQYESRINRTAKSLKRYLVNKYQIISKGEWTKEEDDQLRALVAIHGRQWAELERMIGKAFAKERYRILEARDQGESRKWKYQDFMKLKKVGAEMMAEMDIEDPRQFKAWTALAAKFPGTTPANMKDFWKTVMLMDIEAHPGFPPALVLEFLRKIQSSGAHDESEVPWTHFINGLLVGKRSNNLPNMWKKLKAEHGDINRSLQENVELIIHEYEARCAMIDPQAMNMGQISNVQLMLHASDAKSPEGSSS